MLSRFFHLRCVSFQAFVSVPHFGSALLYLCQESEQLERFGDVIYLN